MLQEAAKAQLERTKNAVAKYFEWVTTECDSIDEAISLAEALEKNVGYDNTETPEFYVDVCYGEPQREAVVCFSEVLTYFCGNRVDLEPLQVLHLVNELWISEIGKNLKFTYDW